MDFSKDIQLPSISSNYNLTTTFDFLDKFIADIILWLAYGIAVLCVFKFFIYILNGFASKPYMGAEALANPSFGR
jgi:hypothetical protein